MFPPALVLLAHLHIRTVVSFIVEHIMASASSPPASTDDVVSENEEEVPTSQASSAFSMEVHAAAASLNAKKKAEKKAEDLEKAKTKRKAQKMLTMPETVSVSALQVSLDDAKKKRDEAKEKRRLSRTK